MIHEANPKSRTVVMTVYTHNVHPFIHNHHCRPDCGLALWIIDDSYLV